MNLKKIPYYLLLIFLTLGASLIIGLLSFGGLYVLFPNLLVASFSFILSVAYEGEIYLQNIKGALNKLLNHQFLTIEYAKTFLRDYFPHHVPHENRPSFYLEYEHLLHQLHAFEHQALTPSRRAKKLDIQRQLKKLEKKFAEIIRLPKKPAHKLSEEDQALFSFLQHYPLAKPLDGQSYLSLNEKFQALLNNRRPFHTGIRWFSMLTALFMGIGTSYLLVEIIAIVPLLAALPVAAPLLIVPMAIISGLAYGLLTYNTLSNILVHDRIRGRLQKLRDDFKKNGLTWRNAFMIGTTAVLGVLAVMLTVCTAGTWWTIVKNTAPLFRWMSKIPSTLIATGTFIVTSIAALAFNLENSSESLDMIDDAMSTKNSWKRDWENFKYRFKKQWQRENIIQRLNPFRFILAVTLTPLRFILFLGHLISMGVTSDRVPGLSQVFSAFLGIVSELFEDGHYFIKHKHHQHNTESLVKEHLEGSDHHHEDDLPSRLINFLATPLRFLSKLWTYVSSQFNTNKNDRLSWNNILNNNEIAPAIPLQHPPVEAIKNTPPSVETKKEKSPLTSMAKISNYFRNNKPEKAPEDPIFSSCPCCPVMPFIPYQQTTRPLTTVVAQPNTLANTRTLEERREILQQSAQTNNTKKLKSVDHESKLPRSTFTATVQETIIIDKNIAPTLPQKIMRPRRAAQAFFPMTMDPELFCKPCSPTNPLEDALTQSNATQLSA